MKKFLLKGKQLISKKLQQFDIETPTIDYVAEQTPTRLKQSLQVLRENQIDLEDTHNYQSYFKNYPNHHISHYLLNKLKENKGRYVEQKQGEQQKYVTPKNTNQYIPNFDQKLQSKALAFKQAIQDYQQSYSKVDSPLVCICVVHFHHKRGTQIQYSFPKNQKLSPIFQQIVHHAMPDSSHLRDEDYNFFNFESDCFGKKKMMFGVSYFKQIKITQEMKKNNVQFTRSHVQKAVSIISSLPLFQYLKLRLQNTTEMFFENFTNFDIIQQAYNSINQSLIETWLNIQLPDLYMGCDLKKIVSNFGVNNLFDIWKALLYQKRVVVFAQTSSDASSFILSLLSLFPGLSAFGLCSKSISKYLQSLRQYALPLRIFSSKNILSISFHVQDFHLLSKFMKNDEGNFLLGTTNRLLKQSNQYGIQMLVNLQDSTIIKNKSRRPWESLTKKQKNFISQLKQVIERQQNGDPYVLEDTIRSYFQDFLKSALITMISGIKKYHIFINQCLKYQKQLKKQQLKESTPTTKKKSAYKIMQDEQQSDVKQQQAAIQDYAPTFPQQTNQIILPQMLLNKSFAYFRQFHNVNLPQIAGGVLIPSIFINNYEYVWRINNDEQIVIYNWLQKKLQFGKGCWQNFDGKEIRFRMNPNLQIISQNQKQLSRSIYIGLIQNGRYNKHGFYVDNIDYYQGQFMNGYKHGYGKYSNADEKYIGNFKNNLYEGEGQLIKVGSVYAGAFKGGLKHGFGSIQGQVNYSGEWKFDKIVSEADELNNLEKIKEKQRQRRKSSGSQIKKK